MIIEEAKLPGVNVIDIERHSDDRGYFARTWCVDEFAEAGLHPEFVQSSISFNTQAGTLRGMHLQRSPHGETKLIRCVGGAVYDVLLDLRPDSPTYRQWEAFELTAHSQRALLVPPGIAHGFQTLAAATTVTYDIDTRYAPDHATGVRWDDPAFAIAWPTVEQRILSDKDARWPDFDPDTWRP